MSKLLSLLRSPLSAIAGVLIFVGIIGFYLTRLGLNMGSKYIFLALGGILLIVLLIAGIYYLWRFLEKRRGKKMEDELGNQEAMAKKQQRRQAKLAVQDIQSRWADTLATLKASKVNMYDLPWFLLIGEPQSGKTTTLRESGLDFPLGKDALSGAGGTVNCDWWFTNDAVILDTAGRFTMPVDTAPDRQEWHAFLKLLAKYRPRCPINGVVITIPATSLLQDSPETIQQKTKNIQEKLQELVKVLGIEFPVYIMVSKLDLVYGFAEFCASLSAQERVQAVGWNRRDITTHGFNPAEYNTFFERYVSRLHSWSLRRLRDLPAGSEADRVYAFPSEFNRLKETLGKYLSLIFREDRFHTPLLLRGCYFSSGLQEGRSIAKALLSDSQSADQGIMAEFAKSFVQSRAYFINIFYRKIFQEQGLVNRAGKIARKEMGIRIAAGVTAVLVLGLTSWMLITGYNRLLNMVEPIDIHVKKAQSLLLSPAEFGSPNEVFEAITILDTLEEGRVHLMEEGARRFLKTNRNTIVRKLGRIEDALFEQKILHPMLAAAGANFSTMGKLADPKQKERFLKLLVLYLDTKSGKSISRESIAAAFDFVPWNTLSAQGIKREEVERLIANYPYGDMPNFSYAKFGGNMFQVRDGLGRLQEFWTTYYPLLWEKIRTNVDEVNTSYANLNTMVMSPGDENSYNTFTREAGRFTSSIDFLSSVGQEHLVWTTSKRVQCFADYLLLEKSLNENVGDIASLTSTTTRHSKTCLQIERETGSKWLAFIHLNHHAVENNGILNADMLVVKKALQTALEFGPLFTDEENEKLQSPSGDPVAVLDFWGQSWNKEKEAKSQEIGAMLAGVSSAKWQQQGLPPVVDAYLQHIVWQSERDATIAAMKALSEKDRITTASLSPGMDPPRMARAAWLASQYASLDNLYKNLQTKYPAAGPGLKPVLDTMTEIMLLSWQECLKFWSNTLKGIQPGGRILSISSWQSFRQEVLSQQGLFLDTATWPMDAFFDFMSLQDISQAKEILWATVNKSLSSSTLRSMEQNVAKTAYVYSGNHYLPQLEQAQNDFYYSIKQLSDDATQSWKFLNRKPEIGSPGNMDQFTALTAFQRRVERDALGRGEILADRLAAIEEHGLMLLREKVAGGFQRSWQAFLGNWRGQLQNKFPFGDPQDWITTDNIDGNTRTLSIAAGSLAGLNDFFFSPEQGFESFVQRYGLLGKQTADSTASYYLSASQKNFLKNCQKWRLFLFDDRGKPKRHRIEVKIDEGDSQAEQAATRFTQVLFNGMEDEQRKTLRLRFSGSRYKRGESLWDLHSAAIITIEAKNEETGMKTALRLAGGSLAFPAYIINSGEQIVTTRSSEWRVDLQLPESLFAAREASGTTETIRKQPGFAIVPLRIAFDEQLPDPLIWPAK